MINLVPTPRNLSLPFKILKIKAGRDRAHSIAVTKPVGDNARRGAVKERSQMKTKLGGASAWTKRDRVSGEFMAVKKPARK